MPLDPVDWLVVLIPLLLVICIAIKTQRYVKSVADFMTAGRAAGRYLVCNASMEAGMGAITIVACFQMYYVSGFAMGWWRNLAAPVFLIIAFSTDDGQYWVSTLIFGVVGWSDYFDGIAARLTGQYSRMGALLDPVVDRLLVLSGVIVCWKFELLPRWALALLAARELFMIVLARVALSRGVDLKINWLGRWGVWPATRVPRP